MQSIKRILPGIIIVLTITMGSFMLSLIHPAFDALVISIIFGMIAAAFISDKNPYVGGIDFALNIFLPIGIALYGTQLSFAATGLKGAVCVIIISSALFIITYFVSQSFGITKNTGILLSTGLSVCGASAIAIVSPLINAKKEDTSISIITVMAVGLAGMIFFPLLNALLVLSTTEYAFLSGATLPMLGQVKAVVSPAGLDALAIALGAKLFRISFLIFLPVIAIMLSDKKNKLRLHVPWFTVVFIALAIVVNITRGGKNIAEVVEPVSKFFLSSALTAIGLSVDINSIAEEGVKPVLSVFLSWGIVVLFLYLAFSVGNV